MSNNLIYIPGIFLLLSQQLLTQQVGAEEYVPPPTGPYKSAVVINNDRSQTGNSDQVYKFPSDSMIETGHNDVPVFLSDRRILDLPQKINSKATVAVIPPQKEVTLPISPLEQPAITKSGPLTRQYSRNPWAPGSLPGPDSFQGNYYQGGGYQDNRYQGSTYPGYYYQGNMNNPQYAYPQQNPYANSNQNNFMNDSFNNMPSPWSVMPMQSFFSGR